MALQRANLLEMLKWRKKRETVNHMFLHFLGLTESFSNRVSPGHSSIGLRGRRRKKGKGKKQMLCTA